MDIDEAGELGREIIDQGEQAAQAIRRAKTYQVLVKVGLVAYGVVHLTVAWLAVRLVLGHRDGEASHTGALRELATTPIGELLLWVAGIGLLTLVVWQLIAAAIGYREFDGTRRLRKRLSALGRTLIYGWLGVAALRIALGPEADEGEQIQESISAGLLGLPGGQVLVALVGLGVIAYGARTGYKGVTGRYNDEIEIELRGIARLLAGAGHLAKAIAYLLIGALFWWAAFSFDPEKAGGLDEVLQTVLGQPSGSALLLVMAAGIGSYGVWCFFLARHAKHA